MCLQKVENKKTYIRAERILEIIKGYSLDEFSTFLRFTQYSNSD